MTASWPQVQSGRVTAYSLESDLAAAGSLADRAEECLGRLEQEFGVEYSGRVSLILASTEADFRQAQPQGSAGPAWAAGLAYPDLGLIIIKSRRLLSGGDPGLVLVHELVHLILAEVFQGRRPPVWLNEGLTMHLAGEWSLNRQTALIRAMLTDRLIPLEDLVRSFPENELDAETAYAQSYYLIAFLRDRYGADSLGRLIRRLAVGVDYDYALFEAAGIWPSEMEDLFEDWLRSRFSLFWVIANPWTIWGAAAVLLVLAAWRRRRLSARKMAEWEAEEDDEEFDDPGRS